MNDKEIIEFFKNKNGKIDPNKTRIKFLDKYPEIKEYLENRYEQFFDYKTSLLFIFNGDQELPKCENCGKVLTKPNKRWCNTQCQLTDPKYINYRVHAIDYEKSRKKAKQTCLEKYGVDAYVKTEHCIRNSHTKEARRKASESNKQTCLKRYGVENTQQVPEIRARSLQTKLKNRPNDPNNSKKIQQTMLERYGATGTLGSPELRKKVEQTKLERYNNKKFVNPDKIRKTCEEKYGENPTLYGSAGFKQHMKEVYGEEYYSQTEYFKKVRYKKYFYNNIFFNSSYELCFYKYHIDHNIPIEVEPIRLEYYIDGKKHIYIPDFRVNNQLVEIKGSYFFEDGKMINPFDRSLDYIYEAKHQCMISNNVNIIIDCSLYTDYCGRDFIKKHEVTKNLSLDYLEWKPLSTGNLTCIYIAKKANWKEFYKRELDLWKSSCKVRMNLLKNRAKYIQKTEEELTDLEILRGLNISGKIKSYSTFDNTRFITLLDKYNINSVYDPCAGWGERLVTCAAKNINYFGIDINENVIKGHKQIIKHYGLINQNTIEGDSSALKNTTNSELVFTCPPYFDQEIYSDKGAENLDEEHFLEWWKQVIVNSINSNTKYFAFQINQKHKDKLVKVINDLGLSYIETILLSKKANHFNINNKSDYESIEVFRV